MFVNVNVNVNVLPSRHTDKAILSSSLGSSPFLSLLLLLLSFHAHTTRQADKETSPSSPFLSAPPLLTPFAALLSCSLSHSCSLSLLISHCLNHCPRLLTPLDPLQKLLLFSVPLSHYPCKSCMPRSPSSPPSSLPPLLPTHHSTQPPLPSSPSSPPSPLRDE